MWTAFVLGALVTGGTAVYVCWGIHVVADGAPLWAVIAGLPLTYLAFPLFFTTLWFTLAWWFRAEPPPQVRLSPLAWCRMFAGEFRALARSAPRMILYRVLVPEPAPRPAVTAIVLLHGVGCNAGVWAGFRRHCVQRSGPPVYALSYGPPLHSIEHFADQLAARIADVEAASGATQVILVCHSMGGLVARAYMRRYGGERVRRLVTIGTPHHGSMHAWLMSGVSLAQLRPGNAWLAQLNRDAGAARVPSVSIWSWHDSMVAPQTSSRIDWGENVALAGIAHNALLDHPRVWAEVDAQIERAITSESPA